MHEDLTKADLMLMAMIEKGYFKADAVWKFEIRYEFNTTKNTYLFKIFIENAGKTKNGKTINYYRLVEK